MFSRLLSLFRSPQPATPSYDDRLRSYWQSRRAIAAKYDAAQTTADNVNHWKWADDLSAITANDPAVRKILRKRSRYEVANNSYARGLALTLANDAIGPGPRLQLLTPDKQANRQIEREFSRWAAASHLAEKLRTLRMAKMQDGEAFAVLSTNRRLRHPVKLDIKLVESDRVSTPYSTYIKETANAVDGIRFDEFGNPEVYHILRAHPGEVGSAESDNIAAENVIHWFRVDRPGQLRGVPEITAALPLFAMLRDFTVATLDAAKAAAAVSFVLKTAAGAYTDASATTDQDVSPFEAIEFVRNMGMTLPEGYDISQFKSEHPQSNMQMFVDVILREIGRCLNVPKAVITGDSSSYNFASGRMDGQVYWKSIEVERKHCENIVLDRVFEAWLDEALLERLIPAGVFDAEHQWFWPGREHVDPTKNATARTTNLVNGTTHRGIEYAVDGRDVDYEDERAAETFGVTVEEYRQALFGQTFSAGAMSEPQEEDDDAEVADGQSQAA